MKKNSKRQIRNYEKYRMYEKEYYGLFIKHGKAKIDVKRFTSKCDISDDIKKMMNKSRTSVYFLPNKTSKYDYMINIFKSAINDQKDIWINEIMPVIEKIKSPKEVEEDSRLNSLHFGILDHDEVNVYALMKSFKRELKYSKVIKLMITQYIHQFVSFIESRTLKVLSLNGYKNETFSRRELDSFIQGRCYIKLSEIKHYEKYDRIYNVWHFLKHNSMDLYNKIQKYPELLIEDHDFMNGEMAMDILKIDFDFIEKMYVDFELFFEEFCSKVFNENLTEAFWNYDDYFKNIVNENIKQYNAPWDFESY